MIQRIDRQSLFDSIALEIAEAVGHRKKLKGKKPFLIGAEMAPLFIGYIIFIAECSVKNRLQKLFFITREGEFLQKVFKTVFPQGKIEGKTTDMALPAANLLEVSRLSTFGASLPEINIKAMMPLWRLFNIQSISALCKSLGIIPELVGAHCAAHKIELNELIQYPWRDRRVLSLFRDHQFIQIVQSKLEADRNILKAYLQQKLGSKQDEKIGLVDIGWRGTIQDNIAWLLPHLSFLGIYLGLAHFLNRQPPNSQKVSFGPNLNLSSKNENFFDNVTLLEMLANSSEGSVTGYKRSDSKLGDISASENIYAVKLPDKNEKRIFSAFTGHFQEGVLLAASIWSKYIGTQAIASREMHPYAIGIWDGLSNRTPKEIIDVYSTMSHKETFGIGAYIDKELIPKTGKILYAFFSKKHRYEVILFVKYCQRVRYIQARNDIGYLSKIIWSAVIFSALFYKRTVMKVMRRIS